MSDTSLKNFILPALLTTGAVFTALATPVIMFGSEKLQIENGNQTWFHGTVREAAIPYLSLAGVTSLGLGITGIGIQGWRKSTKRAEKLDHQLVQVQQRLTERETHLRQALTSDSYLAKSGLNFFLEDDLSVEATPESTPQPLPKTIETVRSVTELEADLIEAFPFNPVSHLPSRQPDWVISSSPEVTQPRPAVVQPTAVQPAAVPALPAKPPQPFQEVSYTTHYQISTPMTVVPAPIEVVKASPLVPSVEVQSAVSPLTAAQGFLSFTRTAAPAQPAAQFVVNPTEMNPTDELTIAKIQALQTQLQQIVTQIEALQTHLNPALDKSDQSDMELPATLASRSHGSEAIWLARRAAS